MYVEHLEPQVKEIEKNTNKLKISYCHELEKLMQLKHPHHLKQCAE